VVVVVTGVELVRRAHRQPAPLIPIDLLRVSLLRKSYLTSICAYSGQMIGLVALPFYLMPHFGRGTAGLLITALPLGVLLGAPLSGRLSDRISPGPLGLIGLCTFALGNALLTLIGSGATIGIATCLALAGFGFGLFQAPNNRVMIGEAPRARSGAAAGMLAVCRTLGQTLGALAAALTFRLFGTASWTPFAVAAGFAVTGALVSATRRARNAPTHP
jgi:DHA2 family multidrug resistance protein-like MFS transporter